MKKVLATGMLAICLIAVSQQQASAWTNQRFSIGLNWQHQSGGNSFLWGLWHNGQPPAPELFHGGSSFPQYGAIAPEVYTPFAQGSFDMPNYEPTYAQPAMNSAPPYQFATYPRPVYYYPAPAYYYYSR